MNVLIFLFFGFLGITSSSCEDRVRRQLWPGPPDPNPFWTGNSPQGGFNSGGFNNGGDFNEGIVFEEDRSPWMRPRPSNQNGFDNDRGGDRFNQNQNRRTTENPGGFTQPPRTIHSSPQGCACPSTPQFNPVCGTDGNTYKNAGLLKCYQQCGTNVAQRRLGAC